MLKLSNANTNSIMADDIDELLDEVESKFITAGPSIAGGSQVLTSQSICKKINTVGGAEELDAAIHSICNIPEPVGPSPNPRPVQLDSGGSKKCNVIFVGGSQNASGLSHRKCDKLRCISCDFKVVIFEGFDWDPTADYLFLRLHMPVFEKLRSKLRSKKGWCAYGCQCNCISAKDFTLLSKISNAKWVCSGH